MTLEFAYVRIDMPLHLDSNPKTDRAVAYYPFYSIVTIVHNQHKNAITKVPDGYGMKLLALWLRKNQNNTDGRPLVPYRKIFDGSRCILRTG
jgi:hypothetical protein